MTYCVEFGSEHGVHVVPYPEVHDDEHDPAFPICVELPWVKPVRVCPFRHVVCVPNLVFDTDVHIAVTYCVEFGSEHGVHVPAFPTCDEFPWVNPERYPVVHGEVARDVIAVGVVIVQAAVT